MEMSTIQHGSNPTLFIGPKPTNDILDRVLDKCYCGDYESITSLAECHFDRLVDMLPLHNKTEIAAYAVYATLIQRNTPRSFTEIANLVGIRERTLYKLHSIYHKVERIPSDEVGLFVDRACAFLNLPFELQKKIQHRISQLYEFSSWTHAYSTKTILAACIINTCEEENPIPPKTVCDVCYISVKTVDAFRKKLVLKAKDKDNTDL
jgi:transcription initiation factor TFIIIB Brf1 subunit/transcription initiation factor TFIIB